MEEHIINAPNPESSQDPQQAADAATAASLEALLFVYGEPLSRQQLKKILKIDDTMLEQGLVRLQHALAEDHRGLALLQIEDKVQLGTKADFSHLVQSVVQQETREALTPATLETLSLIAYAGPITRTSIDYVRGVNSSFILRNLLIRGLITRQPDPKRANTYLYQVSFDLLKHLGLSDTKAIPEYEKYKELLRGIADKLA